jgi:hypothetical protein
VTTSASLPFRCDACGARFLPLDGGACVRCRRTLCTGCLSGLLGLAGRMTADGPVCRDCRRAERA